MDAPLTGREAVEALGVYARLGSAGARFDARTVGRSIRSAQGRRRVLSALCTALRAFRSLRVAGRAPRASRASRSRHSGVLAAASPGRPRPSGAGA